MNPSPLAYSYIRFSTPEQAKGDSLRRQTEAAAAWCRKHSARLDEATTLRDLGRSAYTGGHRKNPDRHALAAFLKMVEGGKVPRGSYLIIENLDRLSREHLQPALLLVLNLLQAGIRIVQLSPAEMVFDEKSDTLPVMMMIVELSRGHSESAMKSDRLGKAWDRKRAELGARKLTGKCPFWLQLTEDKTRFKVKPECVRVVRQMYQLAREGYGSTALARRLNEEGVPSPYDRPWNNVSVLWVLRNRAVLGEFTPHRGRAGARKVAGESIADYYPRIISDEEFWAVQAAIASRKKQRGPRGKGVRNLFTELVKDARDGTPMHVNEKRPGDPRLISSGAVRGKPGTKYISFPFTTFERSILDLLREIDPHEILNGDHGPDESLALAGQLAAVEAKIAELEAELLKGDVAALAKVLRQLEGQKADLSSRLAEARRKAASPLSESWGECKSLLAALDAAPDPEETRLRLRGLLRRVIGSVLVLVVPRGRERLAALQIWFADGKRHRDYLIVYRPESGYRKGGSHVWSLADVAAPGDLDLRKPAHVQELEAVLAALDLDALEDPE